MKKILITLLCLPFLMFAQSKKQDQEMFETLEIKAEMPLMEDELKSVNGFSYSLKTLTEKNGIIVLIIGLWILHYFYRTILFPIKLKTKGKKMPLVIVISAFIFNLFNGFFVGYEIGNISQIDFGINTLIGLIIFFVGMYINRTSDNKLISLRKENKEYQIPQGGMFKYISCPNHFGEIVEWIGFAIIVFNLGALSFALWTAFNLIPRALNHHNWYINSFKEYPEKRKAVIPFIL